MKCEEGRRAACCVSCCVFMFIIVGDMMAYLAWPDNSTRHHAASGDRSSEAQHKTENQHKPEPKPLRRRGRFSVFVISRSDIGLWVGFESGVRARAPGAPSIPRFSHGFSVFGFSAFLRFSMRFSSVFPGHPAEAPRSAHRFFSAP